MNFGTRESFVYHECSDCASLQIDTVPPPSELARHYPPEYYSFTTEVKPLRNWAFAQRDRYYLGQINLGGRWVASRRPDPALMALAQVPIERAHSILDVGCGSGELLDRLSRVGFTRLAGLDPFIEATTMTRSKVPIAKQRVSEATGRFDVVMFNHSLEHVPDPLADLQAASQLLAPGGLCLVRMPTPSSEAWQTYGVDWVQLDAPRHLVLISRPGVELLAGQAGLDLVRTIDDSSSFQFAASELHGRDIALSEAADFAAKQQTPIFRPEQMSQFDARADEVNRRGVGDQALWVLRKN